MNEPRLSNLPEFTVSEISRAVKATLEGNFERVRVRGEVSKPNYHGSGHLYFSLKDDSAVIDAVCWRSALARMRLKVEHGMEVVATGRISSYPGSSKYQIVVDTVELAGEGALLKLLEERRRKLAAEGLFDAAHKKKLPMLPEVIGVVTSPTGAVIRDILHRLADRFPRSVLLWPVAVQGEGAAEQVAAAIRGFNALLPGGSPPRPDLIIVARGGGSLEDLWAFNEEIVVRAVAASAIPLISAIGHETDTTLIDFAADRRAPTPTAAAEMAVPVRAELLAGLTECAHRLAHGIARQLTHHRALVEGLARGLPDPVRLIEEKMQRLDGWTERLALARGGFFRAKRERLQRLVARIVTPTEQISRRRERLGHCGELLTKAVERLLQARERRLERETAHLRPKLLLDRIRHEGAQLERCSQLLESLSYKNVLARGFVLVCDSADQPVTRAAKVGAGMRLSLGFADGSVPAIAEGGGAPAAGAKPDAPGKRSKTRAKNKNPQGSLL